MLCVGPCSADLVTAQPNAGLSPRICRQNAAYGRQIAISIDKTAGNAADTRHEYQYLGLEVRSGIVLAPIPRGEATASGRSVACTA
jgi:hypothetical protein